MISFYLCNLVTHKGNDASLAKQEFPFIDTDLDIDTILNHKPIVCCLLRSESKLRKQERDCLFLFLCYCCPAVCCSLAHLHVAYR